MKKIYFAALASVLLSSCTSRPTLEGVWVQPIPGQQEKWQGFILSPNGTANSLNMKTLLYKNWEREGDTLTLTGKSIGNKQTINFTSKATIKKLTADTLTLETDGTTENYSRGKQ